MLPTDNTQSVSINDSLELIRQIVIRTNDYIVAEQDISEISDLQTLATSLIMAPNLETIHDHIITIMDHVLIGDEYECYIPDELAGLQLIHAWLTAPHDSVLFDIGELLPNGDLWRIPDVILKARQNELIEL